MSDATGAGAQSTRSSDAEGSEVFLCERCHAKSSCRSEVHLDIIRTKCEACKLTAVCLGCKKAAADYNKSITNLIREMYRNTKQLPKYRKINI